MEKINPYKLIDITLILRENLPAWPGTPRFKKIFEKQIEQGDDCNSSILTMDSHAGTHIDAPFHFLKGKKTAEQLDLNKLMGPALVLDF